MFCEECGARIIEGNAYCIYCGVRVRSQDTVPRQWDGPKHLRKNPKRKRRAVFFVLLIVAVAVAGYLFWDNTGSRLGDKQFARGDRYLMEHSYRNAVEAFTNSINNGYADANVYLGLAEAYALAKDTDSAISALEDGMAAASPDVRRLLAGKLFRIYRDLLKNEDADTLAARLETIIERHDTDTCRLLAEAYAAFGDADTAIAILSGLSDKLDPAKVDAAMEVLRAKAGNTSGNITNGGSVAQQGEWLYYISNWDDVLYKVRTDGEGWTKICDDEIVNLNVLGNVIYYRNWSDEGALYSIHTDGTKRTKLTADSVFHPIVSGGWIYYFNDSDNGRLYKIRTDGRGRTRLNGDESQYANLVGDWIYYTDLYDIYKVRTDGKEMFRVMDCGSGCGYLVIDGDWMYYCDEVDYGRICRARTDGTEQTVITGDLSGYFNIAGGWIYYSNYSDGEKLYKVRTDGSGRTKIGDDECRDICIVEDWIYFCDGYDYFRIRPDGTQWQKVK